MLQWDLAIDRAHGVSSDPVKRGGELAKLQQSDDVIDRYAAQIAAGWDRARKGR